MSALFLLHYLNQLSLIYENTCKRSRQTNIVPTLRIAFLAGLSSETKSDVQAIELSTAEPVCSWPQKLRVRSVKNWINQEYFVIAVRDIKDGRLFQIKAEQQMWVQFITCEFHTLDAGGR